MGSKEIFNGFSTFHGRYAVEMLCGKDSQFIDIYKNDDELRTLMKSLVEQNDVYFYKLACEVFYTNETMTNTFLKSIFNTDRFQEIQKISNDKKEEYLYVPTVEIIPGESMKVMPFEGTTGNRALRCPSLGGVENFCLVYFKPHPATKFINKCRNYLEALKNGVEICHQRYFFFGCSNSQLKSHSYWFYRANNQDEIQQKRDELGDFSGIKNVGKYVSRLGLWFTTTKSTDITLIYVTDQNEFNQLIQQDKPCATRIDDIDYNGYCFTDGCGLISKGLARLLAKKLQCFRKCQDDEIYPSAYQIRVAGCKGLVIIEPESTFDQFYLKIRTSMIKYPSNHWNLEICDESRAIPTQLNNQITTILSDLGVRDEVFFHFQQRWFQSPTQAPTSKIDLLKNKFPLPFNECRYMFGCALESKLQSGQCFIRYEILNEDGNSFDTRRFQTVTGPVLVTKNPCPYAGDLRQLEAIDLPELHCLKDVIVFSVRGDRPDFHKIAGSDLDGDQYFVYWGNEIQIDDMIEPLPYSSAAKPNEIQPITYQSVIDFHYNSLGPTIYGEIYNLHAVVVDRNLENNSRRTCQQSAIELANIFSSAIDAGKTGFTVDRSVISKIRQSVKINGRTEYPDFLMKTNSYESQSIVGQLYRKANEYFQSHAELRENDRKTVLKNNPTKKYRDVKFYVEVRTKLNVPVDTIIYELKTVLKENLPPETTIHQWFDDFQKENISSSDHSSDASGAVRE